MKQSRNLWVTAAAVVAFQSPSTMGFAPQPVSLTRRMSTTTTTTSPALQSPCPTIRSYSTSLPSMRPNDNKNDSDGGIFGGLQKAAKSVLPKSWFQSEEERRQEEEKMRLKKEISGGLSQMFKDAPLPIRMMGNLVAPLMGSALSSLAEAAQEQQATMQQIQQQASFALQNDVAVQQALGSSIQVLAPVSQSSSSSNINGQVSTRIQLQVPVVGSLDQGMAALSANEKGLQSIVLQTQSGRRINVPVSVDASSSSSTHGRQGRFGGNRDDNIIEAEIIDKKNRD